MFADTWVVVRKSPNEELEAVYVYGTLEFEFKKSEDIVFAVTYLLVYGSVFGGWPDNPMENLLTIQLRGDKYTSDLHTPDGPNMGAKAIGVLIYCYYYVKPMLFSPRSHQLLNEYKVSYPSNIQILQIDISMLST